MLPCFFFLSTAFIKDLKSLFIIPRTFDCSLLTGVGTSSTDSFKIEFIPEGCIGLEYHTNDPSFGTPPTVSFNILFNVSLLVYFLNCFVGCDTEGV